MEVQSEFRGFPDKRRDRMALIQSLTDELPAGSSRRSDDQKVHGESSLCGPFAILARPSAVMSRHSSMGCA